jgi:hypothetical protein
MTKSGMTAEDKKKPENWRPITFTSILYRTIANQIVNFLQDKKNE